LIPRGESSNEGYVSGRDGGEDGARIRALSLGFVGGGVRGEGGVGGNSGTTSGMRNAGVAVVGVPWRDSSVQELMVFPPPYGEGSQRVSSECASDS
jgi:hypothetical protein